MFLTFRPPAPQPETRSSGAATILAAPRLYDQATT